MSTYFITIGLVGFFCLGQRTNNNKIKKFSFIMCILILILIAGLRYQVGRDYSAYASGFYDYAHTPISILNQPGIVIVARIANLIYPDYATWFFIMSMLTVLTAFIVIKKYSVDIPSSIMLYVFLGCWHFSFNLVKQCAASGILLLGFSFLSKRKLAKWVIICIIASSFHVTALLMIPVYFLMNGQMNRKKLIIFAVIGIIVMFGYDYLFSIANMIKMGRGIISLSSDTRNSSVNILRVIVNCSPSLLFILYKKIYDYENDEFRMLSNMSAFNTVLNIAAMNSIYLTRFCIYTNAFNIFFIPSLLKPLKRDNRLSWKTIIYILYFVFWAYDLYKGSTTVVFHWIFER